MIVYLFNLDLQVISKDKFFADTYFLPTLHMNDREAVGLIAQELDVEQINKKLEASAGPVVSFALEDLTVPALFEHQAHARPESTALVFESDSRVLHLQRARLSY